MMNHNISRAAGRTLSTLLPSKEGLLNRRAAGCLLLILLLVSLTGTGLSAEENKGFKIEPYLIDVTENSATVCFFLYEPLPARVTVFESAGGKEIVFPSPAAGTSHFVKITGLKPGHAYRYQVCCGTPSQNKGNPDNMPCTPVDDTGYQIRTAARPGEFFTFAVYGDPRPGDNLTQYYHRQVIDQALVNEPVFTLVLGDMVDDGANDENWADFFHVEAPLLRRSCIFPVLGDNDYASGAGKYLDYFPFLKKGYYRFDWGGAVFFGLFAWDTRGGQPVSQFDRSSPQYKWFEKEIAKPVVQQAPFRVVFMHDPVYISRGRLSETLRRTWAPLFQRYRVDVVFASWHIYERSNDKGVTYIISGGGGAELLWMNPNPNYPSQVDAQQYHFCRVDVGPGALDIRAVATDGTVLDSFTLTPRGRVAPAAKEKTGNLPGSGEPGISTGETTSPASPAAGDFGAEEVARKARRLAREILINKGDADTPEIPVYLFSFDCDYCRRLLNHVLPRMARQKGVAFKVYYFDLAMPGTYDLFLNAGAEFGRQDADIPAIMVGRRVLGGKQEIEKLLPVELAAFRAGSQDYYDRMVRPFRESHDTDTMGDAAFDALTWGIVFAAGLLDGINPCAFTTIIFLISYLSLMGVSRRRMLVTGGIFTVSVFLTYFVIGLAFFKFAGVLLRQQNIAQVVNVLLLAFLLVLALLSFRDFLKCLKGKASDMTLQLPGFLKRKIHERIRQFARRGVILAGTSFVLGIVIAGMELTCTGQVYIPIVTMISEPQHRLTAVYYLLLYNAAFIVPLLVVFLLVFFGLTSEKLAAIFKRHTAAVKLGFSILFIIMALFIIMNI